MFRAHFLDLKSKIKAIITSSNQCLLMKLLQVFFQSQKNLTLPLCPVILNALSLLLCHMMMSNDKATVKAHVQRHAHAVYLYLSTHKHTERQAEQAKSKRNDCPGENRQCFFSLQSSSFTTSLG